MPPLYCIKFGLVSAAFIVVAVLVAIAWYVYASGKAPGRAS